HAPVDGLHPSAYPGLWLLRFSGPSGPNCGLAPPSITIATQGAKRVELGEDVYEYDASHFLMSSYDLPVQGRVTCASAHEPYLAAVLDIDARRLGEIVGAIAMAPAEPLPARGLTVGRTTAELLDPLLRL